jgi:two-component system, NtrC family, sensor histidine kinase PilS
VGIAADNLASVPPETKTPELFRKLLWLTGLRLLVGTALLTATAVLSFGSGGETLPGRAEELLYAIIASIYLGSLISVAFLRSGRFLSRVALGQIVGDVIAASGLVYLTGGAESIFTVLYPLAIVNAAIGLGRRGALAGAVLSAFAFCLLALGMEYGLIAPPLSSVRRCPRRG